MAKQTALEWFKNWMIEGSFNPTIEEIELAYQKALKMERDQIIDAFDHDGYVNHGEHWISNGIEYYNKTFKNYNHDR